MALAHGRPGRQIVPMMGLDVTVAGLAQAATEYGGFSFSEVAALLRGAFRDLAQYAEDNWIQVGAAAAILFFLWAVLFRR